MSRLWPRKSPPPVKAARPKPRKALFLHVQKTAGTTVVRRAAREYGRGNFTSHGDYLTQTIEDARACDFVSGHFGMAHARQFMEGRYFFTFFRDPRERLLSLYSFCKSRDPKQFRIYALAQKHPIEDFLSLGLRSKLKTPDDEEALLVSQLWNNQAWFLSYGWFRNDADPPGFVHPRTLYDHSPAGILAAATGNLNSFDFIGFVETLDEDAKLLSEALGFSSRQDMVPVNTSASRIRLDDLSASTLAVLDDLTELDRELYQTAFSRRSGKAHSS